MDLKLNQHQLINILLKQMQCNNKDANGPYTLSFDEIYAYAETYYQWEHIDKYRILSHYFEPDEDTSFLKDLELKFKKKGRNNINVQLCQKYEYRISSTEDMECFFKGELWETNLPNELFYALARILRLSEEDIIFAFHGGWCLSMNFYIQQRILDTCQYYYNRNCSSISELERRIKEAGIKHFGATYLSSMLKGELEITEPRFDVLSSYLEIPKDIVESCRYFINISQNLLPYRYGYAYAIDSIIENYEEYYSKKADVREIIENALQEPPKESALESEIKDLREFRRDYNERFPTNEEVFFRRLYEYMDFSFDCCSSQTTVLQNPSDKWLLSGKKIQVTLPDGKTSEISRKDYLNIIGKISEYAEYLLWNEVVHPEIPNTENDSSLQEDYSYFDCDTEKSE